MKSALLLYPHQLFPLADLPEVDTVIMVEEPLFFGTDRSSARNLHKQKLILHRASMRRYAEEILWPAKLDVEYIGLDVLYDSSDILERANKFDQLYVFDPLNDVLTKRLLEARRERSHAPQLQFLPHPDFYLKEQELRQYFAGSEAQKNGFPAFYQWQRERFNILIGENYKPVGGQWMFEGSKSTVLPKELALPSFEAFGDNKFVQEAAEFVERHFAGNPGSTDFIWPTNHHEAGLWLDDFVANRLDQFAAYQEALDGQANWLYHSALSSSLNIGLLKHGQVIDAAIKRHQKDPVPLESLEVFVRQILGWREYVRGQYVIRHSEMRSSNPFKHQRRMTGAWFDGNLGIPPLDDVIKKLQNHAYAHHNERLMVAGNFMVLAEISPEEIYRWFHELFIDSYEWVMLPNIYNLSHLSNTARLPISPSNYLLQNSSYERGVWSDVWDGLFWRFVEKHRSALKHNPHMRTLCQRLDRLDPDHRRIIHYRAEDFLSQHTLF